MNIRKNGQRQRKVLYEKSVNFHFVRGKNEEGLTEFRVEGSQGDRIQVRKKY